MNPTALFVFAAVCAASALSLAETEKKSKPPATVSPAAEFKPNATTHAPTTHAPTTHAPTTHAPTTHAPTTHAPTTHAPTTHAPTTANTTTHAPTTANTTTSAPTTANTTTHAPTTANTTTSAPTTANTTTPEPTTTTAKPTVPPPPTPTPPTNLTVGNYTVTTDEKVICLMAQMALQIRLETPQTNGTFVVQPKLTKAQGGCQETKANLTLVFKEGFITFMFNKSTPNNTVYVDALSFTLSYPFSKGVPGNGEYTANNKSVTLFAAMIGHSYSCRGESLYMGNGLFLDVNQDRMQAFNLTNNDFGVPDACPADKSDYHVAIAVGVTLVALIVIVLIAYLLGRKRRTGGYQSL